jgi:hypothetical protein
VDLNGKSPLIDRSVAWAREPSGEHRTTERHRVRRRTRARSEIRSRIRRRVVIACVGALVFMVVGIYLAIMREGPSSASSERGGAAGAPALAGSAAT